MSAARVLVTDAGRGSAIAVIRSLGRRGLHVIATDHDRRSPGFRSRYAAERIVLPDPAADPAGVVDRLHALAAAGRVDLIVPVTDEVLLPLSDARERFDGLCALAIPDRAALATAGDKAATLELARRLGVPVPPTVVARTADEALAAASDLGWPVVLKPASSRVVRDGVVERFEVVYADGPVALAAAMRRFEGRCAVLAPGVPSGRGPRRGAARRPRAAAPRVPAPSAARGADHGRRQRPPGGRGARSRAARPRHAPGRRARLDGAGHGRVPRRARPGPCSWRSTAASGARSRSRSRAERTFPWASPRCTWVRG